MVLVTGGCGYIGSAVVRYLLASNTEVVVVDLEANDMLTGLDHLAIVRCDYGDEQTLRSVLKEFPVDAVVHLAGLSIVSDSMRLAAAYLDANVGKTVTLLEVLRTEGIDRLVFSSSAAVYGDAMSVPIRETDALNPSSPYGLSKLFVEQLLTWAKRSWGLRSIALRYFNAAGGIPEWNLWEHHSPETHLIPTLINCVRSGGVFNLTGGDFPTADGSAVRDFVHVQDIAAAHVGALRALTKGVDGSFNVGSGSGHSVLEVIKRLEKIAGAHIKMRVVPRRPGDPPILVADVRAIKDALGWEPKQSGLDAIIGSACAELRS